MDFSTARKILTMSHDTLNAFATEWLMRSCKDANEAHNYAELAEAKKQDPTAMEIAFKKAFDKQK